MESIQTWFLETWLLIKLMVAHPIFTEWLWYTIGSFALLFIGTTIIISVINKNPNSTEMSDRIVYKCGMWGFALQAIIFTVYPILFRSAILLFSWILFSPFILILVIDIIWFFVLKNKYDNNPEDITK